MGALYAEQMTRDIFYILAIVILSFALARSHRDTPPQQVVRVDTTIYYSPKDVASRIEPRAVTLPRLIFVEHRDTVIQVVADSVSVEVELERRTYRDSTFEATISGVRVGDLRPTLDEIRVFSKSTTLTIEQLPAQWWELNATAGVTYHSTADVWCGAEFSRHSNRWSYGGVVGCTAKGSPVVGLKASFSLVRGGLNR